MSLFTVHKFTQLYECCGTVARERKRSRERWGPQQKRIKDVSIAAWREKREREKERAIVYMFEK